ncbi:DUF4398 domain-containing protein [Pseudomonas putida]|uniref:Chromosome partitioning protein ParA n=1 Tax=Pseudomonas putida TaxID=303 RepID=A0AAD0L6N8_PSEPU|nr:DUF4398 domain-containing protein [Pseudomonas putida]AXA24731.1 chromosome partitioning protein ParA [Pseudomonas putida]
MIKPYVLIGRQRTLILALGCCALLTGCASDSPSAQYAVAQSQVDAAVGAGGTEFAAIEMRAAQDKLKQAAIAMHGADNSEARRLAEQAEWDARVAERKAQAAKAVKAASDAQRGAQDVLGEAMRSAR